MAEERQGTPRSPIAPALAAIAAFLAALALGGPSLAAAETSIGLTKANQRGAFNVGSATANVGVAPGPDGGEVLKLDYSAPPGTAVGVWTKGFPSGLDAAHIDLVRFAVTPANPDQVGMVAVALEIKGSVGTSRIPLDLGPGWTAEERMVDWKAIGTPNEVVVSVSRVGDGPPASGTLLFDVRFERLSPLRKLSASQPARLGGVLLVAGLAALLAALLNATFPGPAGGWPTLGPSLGRDLIRGIGSVAIVGLAGVVYALGEMGPLDVGWSPLGLAIAGAGLAEWWKVGMTGRHLSAWEAFRDAAVTGILAAASSPLAILQAPGSWSELVLLSQPVAAVVTLLYHASLVVRLGSSGKHLGPVSAAMIVGTPFAVGSLLLLEPGGLVGGFGEFLSFGMLAKHPELAGAVGRVIVLFAFNEWLALMLGLATKRTILRSALAHLMLFAVAVAAIAGPWVAALGSGETVASWPAIARLFAVVASTIGSQAGLWAEAYLVTGLVTDALRGGAPSRASVVANPVLGVRKGMVYSGIYIGGLYILAIVCAMPWVHWLSVNAPLPLAAVAGAIVFPLIKTIIETFDGSQAFFRRVASGYRSPTLYARGAVAGLGLGYAFSRAMPGDDMLSRVEFGFFVGFAAYAGVNLVRDLFAASADRGGPQSWRVYMVQGLLGGAIGAAIGFYLDAVQVEVIITKFHRYVDPGQKPTLYDVYPLLSKWGHINIGDVSGGSSLLFAEALAGVISWSIPSWLFAINRTFMAAYFERQSAPIRALFTREGLIQLVESMIGVLRWGLWMSPIINSFLRPMGEPTWYNQDGAIHTAIAIVRDATTTHEAFQTWSLAVFVALLAHDWFRVLIWLDHMGLRVATLVNLSFLGMDRLDRRLSRFLAPAATARCIPEAVKRFTTWAPLLIPYYIPKGNDWDLAWSRSQAIIGAEHGTLISWATSLSMAEQGMFLIGSIALGSAVFSTARLLGGRSGVRTGRWWRLNNAEYEVNLRENGEIFSVAKGRGYDISRRSYDFLDPAGRAVFLVDETGSWPLIGNLPGDPGDGSRFERVEDALIIANASHGLIATIEITLPEPGDAAEIWSIRVENPTDSARRIKVVPYLEWVLNKAEADRGHTQYNRLFAEVEYARGLHAVLAWDKHSKAMGVLASDIEPDGFLSARVDFIGRARSLRSPRVLETMAFFEAKDTDAHPTFDPIGALAIGLNVPARGEATARLLIGLVADKKAAIDLVSRHLRIPLASVVPTERRRKASHAIRHGEIPPGTPEPYAEFSDDGRKLLVRTPFTTRPFDHTLTNALGHVVVVTNRGLHTTASVNSQQNRVTPDWSDTVTKEVPSEAFYLYDPESDEWYSPTYHPLNDPEASHEAEFGVDGTAVFRMTKGQIETELTVFVPPDEPAGIYLLTVRNHSDRPIMLRVAPYFQLVLSGQPEFSGPLKIRDDFLDEKIPILSFVNPRNTYRTGPAFVAIGNVEPPDEVATTRGRFFGPARDPARPAMVAGDGPTEHDADDDRPVAAFLATMAIPARGEETIVVILGQADTMEQARGVVQKYSNISEARAALKTTRQWWSALMDTVSVRTTHPEFDRYLDWLKYQALAERIWARRGFYQASGAFGFRDQLQDSVNLLWVDPALARKQILLHGSQQFLEGDVVHWFHLLQDGRTGFVGRTHASDNLLWLGWAVVEYVGATGDETILEEKTHYLESDIPFEPLPAGKGGMGFDPLRSATEESIYRHCLRAIDLVLDRRMGIHGLPLMGTGDWNDGLDEIGSEGRGESVWLGFFLVYILDRMVPIIAKKDGDERGNVYQQRLTALKAALELTWRGDRYLRAFHDDGTEIGVKGSGIWEIDALTAAWAVMAGMNQDRERIVFETALATLEREKTILLGWPPLREDSHPYLGRSSGYPEGVRENGMYCHGVQWLVGAARILADRAEGRGETDQARNYRETAYRLWLKITAIPHSVTGEIETYGGQPNQQAADMVTTFEPGRMIWNGYTGAAGWVFRQALEGVLGLRLVDGTLIPPPDPASASEPALIRVSRDLSSSPLPHPDGTRPPAQSFAPEQAVGPA